MTRYQWGGGHWNVHFVMILISLVQFSLADITNNFKLQMGFVIIGNVHELEIHFQFWYLGVCLLSPAARPRTKSCHKCAACFLGIKRTDKLMYIPNVNTQNYPFYSDWNVTQINNQNSLKVTNELENIIIKLWGLIVPSLSACFYYKCPCFFWKYGKETYKDKNC